MLHTLSRNLVLFWRKTPALETCFYLLLGSGFCLASLPFFLALSLIFLLLKANALITSQEKYTYFFSCTALIFMGFFYTHYHNIPFLEEGSSITGNALVKILEKRPSTFFGKTSLYYKASLITFEDQNTILYNNIPCTFTLKPKKEIAANKNYYFHHITLLKMPSQRFQIKMQKDSVFIPIDHSSSLVEWRYLQKLKAEKHLATHIPDTKVFKFLCALTLGYLDNKTLNYEFSQMGLQHLLTISGFHFALLALSLSFLLRPFLSKKLLCITLILSLTLYVLYLGPSPSVSRAWIAIFLYLIAELFEIRSNALNSLGIAFLISFLENPLCITHIGFQLSYLATFGILAFYQPCEKLCRLLIPQRTLSTLIGMPLYQKLFYSILVILRKGLALDLAVNTMTIPILLYHFGQFPLFSFFYNLFIPFLVTGTLFLLLLGFLFSYIDPLCSLIHYLNYLYTREILSLISYCPKGLQIFIYVPHVSLCMALFSLCTFFFLVLHLNRPAFDKIHF